MEWNAISSYFEAGHLERLVRHQVESYNEFVTKQMEATIHMFNPVNVHSEQFYNKEARCFSLEVLVSFVNLQISRPQIHENNGATKLMFPMEARQRNFTYASATTVDLNIQYVVRSGEAMDQTRVMHTVMKNVHLGKIPVMLRSCLCVLPQHPHLTSAETGECRYDPGGYFIINGSEKTVIGQERAAENRVYVYTCSNASARHIYQAEIKCVPDAKRVSPKQVTMYLLKGGHDNTILVNLPRIRKQIPLFIVFRAIGVISDKAIGKCVTLNMDAALLEALKGSLVEGSSCLTQEDAVMYMVGHAMYMPQKLDKVATLQKKREFTLEVLKNDLFPHCHSRAQQVRLLGYMACKLLRCSMGLTKCDDRDTYINKRVDLTGPLCNTLYRNFMNKVVKDMQKQIIREMNTGSWRATDDYTAIVNQTNVYKIIKSSTIENGLKRALSTGDFGLKQCSNKVGVAQVLNRLTYASGLSHLRRVNTPIEKTGKLIQPRKLHLSTFGFLCPAETPEGPTVGVVKNLSYLTHVTIQSDSESMHRYAAPYVLPEEECVKTVAEDTKVFINGAWVGNTRMPVELYAEMKRRKLCGQINPYTSVVFDYQNNEFTLCNDGGRLVRPLFRVVEGALVPFLKTASWDSLMTNASGETVIEYIDAAEQNAAFVAMRPDGIGPRHTHCEIHPSTIFGVLASCIPFPEHNQSPRNTYQCAMGKQAIGVYVTNFHERFDKTAYVLAYPHRPLVETRVMNLLKLTDIPSGMPVMVAIMSWSGYNQEDSMMINEGAIKRGLYLTTIFRTEKDEDKKQHGDAETQCRPVTEKTKGIKFGNYDKLGADGLLPRNTKIENMDIIRGKVLTIRDARNDPTKTIKFEDMSRCYRTEEEAYLDQNTSKRNGDGHMCWKGRIRSTRQPAIGDKFSSRHGQKGTVGMVIPEADMPFTANGIRPDIIINPHAIPSRMTIAQLKETLLGKVLLELGMFGDGTAFMGLSFAAIAENLEMLGYEKNGNEVMYNGQTGEKLEGSIFLGPVFYQRLKHMVVDKQHSRAIGPMVSLTRQPAEGRARDGGLRFGEMERDCMISHGAAAFTKERVYDASDKFQFHVCQPCGFISAYNDSAGIHHCRFCENRVDFNKVKVPYAFKLLCQELLTMNITPRMITSGSLP